MLKYLLLTISLLLFIIDAKPILDEDLIGPHYKKLADNVDSKLKVVQGVGKEKARDIEEVLKTTDPIPTIQNIQLLTTSLIDTNEEIDDESSNSEEENEHQSTKAKNATSSPIQVLSVEEQENQAVFDDKQEILAKKTMPQIIRTANTLSVPTILPQTGSASKPTSPEPPTTPIPSELNEYKKSRPADKHQSKLPIDGQKQLHNVEIMDDAEDFNSKNHESHQQGGSIIQNQLIPDLHEKLDPITMTTISSLILPQKTLKTTENSKNDQESIWTKIIKGVRCSHGDCEGVLVSTTPAGPRELKSSKIIRRARRQDENVAVVCRCLTG